VDTDLILTTGLFFAALSMPMLLAAWVEGRLSRAGLIVLLLAIGLIGFAVVNSPNSIALQDVPDIVLGVLARALN
jgi:hypothetical protein